MTEQIKKIAPVIWEEIQKADSILLHCHPNPDADSVTSALAMIHMLEQLGKKVTVIRGDSYLPKAFANFPGITKIVHKRYLELNLADYDLFIIQDSGSLDRITRYGEVTFPEKMRTVVIDHHYTNTSYGDVNIVDSSYPATANILYDLFTLWGVAITKEIALCLFIGIYDDTGGFKYPGSTSETLATASKLAAINPDYHQVLFDLENTVEPTQIKFMTLVYSSVEHYFDGKLALAAIPHHKLKEEGLSRLDSLGLEMSNKLRAVVGWDIDITFIEYEPSVIGISMRTRDPEKYDLTKIAKPLGGGGHKASAGAELKMPFEEAKHFLLQTIKTAYRELGNP